MLHFIKYKSSKIVLEYKMIMRNHLKRKISKHPLIE